jgi:hypothetical protein
MSIKALKIIVISVGVLLIAGTILLFVALAKEFMGDGKEKSANCQKKINIAAYGEVQKLEFDNTRIYLTTKNADKYYLLNLNRCTGKVLKETILQQ